ncbi:MAG: hypothetical protein JXB38_10265, partial [Anaerolineales bacterium]|nr:hypothetical protein [Anaerolineales bacterium]
MPWETATRRRFPPWPARSPVWPINSPRKIESFRQLIEDNRDEIAALQIIYGQPYGEQHLLYQQVKALEAAIRLAQPNWTTEA